MILPVGGGAGTSALLSAGAQAPVIGAGGEGFAKFVTQALSNTSDALQAAEVASSQALEGKASIQHVVETVMHAERELQMVLAIRDKIVGAYIEISRTTI